MEQGFIHFIGLQFVYKYLYLIYSKIGKKRKKKGRNPQREKQGDQGHFIEYNKNE